MAGSGRRAREVMPEAIRAESAWRVARWAFIEARMLARRGGRRKQRGMGGRPVAYSTGCGVMEMRMRRRLPGSLSMRVRNLLPRYM